MSETKIETEIAARLDAKADRMRCSGPDDYDWNKVSRFNFTYACDGGAWIEFGSERFRQWFCWADIRAKMGQLWIDRQLRKQGWMTGCWVDVEGGSR